MTLKYILPAVVALALVMSPVVVADDGHDGDDHETKFEINDTNEFEISGTVASISGATFVVDDKTITIDPNRTGSFEQKGVLKVGAFVKVEGVVIDDTMFAKEIKVAEATIISRKVEIADGKFHIRGTVSSLNGATFVVAGQTIKIDTSVTGRVIQHGQLNVGRFVDVKGKVVDGKLFAKKIQVFPHKKVKGKSTKTQIKFHHKDHQ